MRAATLVRHGLLYYWRSNLAVIAGVATAAAVLAGALGVGDSVRESLARSALARLGRTSHAVESTTLFREALADELGARLAVATAPVLSVSGVAAHGTSGRRAGEVRVYGVDARFWSLQDAPDPGLTGRDALLSPALHSELQAAEGATILLRLESMAEVPGSSLFGRRDAPGPSLRVVARGELPRGQLGEFSLHPARDAVRAVFVPLASLQRALGVAGRANAVVLALVRASGDVGAALSETVQLEDLGLRLRVLEGAGALQLESTSTLLNDATAHAAQGVAVSQRLSVSQALVHLATTIRSGRRELPYALVAALDVDALRGLAGRDLPGRDVLLLNDWAAQDLEAAPGAALELEYDTWLESGRLEARRAGFRLSAVVPVTRLPAARALVPEYPGITDAAQLSDWDPPFPVDLKRIRPRDEAYWDLHRTTPKAFLSLEAGQRLWGHRLGRLTALRFTPEAGVPLGAARERLASALRDALAPAGGPLGAGTAALRLTDVRAEALAAARGSTDFGEYFAYFSIFLVAAALLLAGLFFRLGIEQRQREVGLLGALGFSAARLRLQFLGEGAALAGLGMLSGMAGAVLYAAIVLWGLRRLWSGTLPTSDLVLHVSTRSLALGVVGVGVAALVAALWTLRDVRRLSLRALLAGGAVEEPAPAARGLAWPMAAALAAALVVGGARVGRVPQTAGFFGAGFLLLASAVLSARLLLGSRPRGPAAIASTAALGRRGAAYRPGRSVSCVALLGFATFVIVAVGAFRREDADTARRQGEAGGYALYAWSLLPVHHDPGSAEGRATLGLAPEELEGVAISRFRASRGDDASCLNLHRPRRPTILAPEPAFLAEGRFAFQASLAETPAEHRNPWLLLERDPQDGAIPAIADASSLAYALHRKLGDVMELPEAGVRLRFVGALEPGLLQGEVLVGERAFLRAFPHESGYRFFLVGAPAGRADSVALHLEQRLAAFGFDAAATAARLAAFHRVENTYIATFQALGALGLLLGIVGLASVLIRNALEQRRELALLRAVGYEDRHLLQLLLAENGLVVLLGLAAGVLPALVAIAPAPHGQRGAVPLALVAILGVVVACTGGLVSWLAAVYIRRLPLLASLRAE